jgi:hypothetical protein
MIEIGKKEWNWDDSGVYRILYLVVDVDWMDENLEVWIKDGKVGNCILIELIMLGWD